MHYSPSVNQKGAYYIRLYCSVIVSYLLQILSIMRFLKVITFVQCVGLENCAICLYMKTKVETTKHPFRLQEVGGWFFLY